MDLTQGNTWHLTWLLGGFGVVLMFLAGVVATIVGSLLNKWFSRTDKKLDGIDKKLDEYSVEHASCRETLSERFAPKEKTSSDIKELFQKGDDHGARIKALEVRAERVDNELIRKVCS